MDLGFSHRIEKEALELPHWIKEFLRFGFEFFEKKNERRRIAIFSVPTRSIGPGLVVVGALCARLSEDAADDIQHHFDRIRNSVLKRRGPQKEILRKANQKGLYEPIAVLSDVNLIQVARIDTADNLKLTIGLKNCTSWYFEGEMPIISSRYSRVDHLDAYRMLFKKLSKNAAFNLQLSDSAICFAGLGSGKSSTYALYKDACFEVDGKSFSLSFLMSILGWSDDAAPRVTYYNTRTKSLDRRVSKPKLVIADGLAAMLDVLNSSTFESSDVICFYERALDRNSLEDVSNQISSSYQWYKRSTSPINFTIPSIFYVELEEK